MIDSTRHRSVFDPAKWGGKRVDVIGLGATGSKIALSLAKLGVTNLHLWDHDVVEEHNLANQVYGLREVGAPKAQAILDRINEDVNESDVTVLGSTHGEWAPGSSLGGVVFCMVDSMAVRRQIFEAARSNPFVQLVIDSRMGADMGHVLTYKPANRASVERYEASLFSDDDAITEVSACGTAITVGPTGDIISGMAVWQFIRFAGGEPTHAELAMGARIPSTTDVWELMI